LCDEIYLLYRDSLKTSGEVILNVSSIEKTFKPNSDHKSAVSKYGMVASAFPDATKAGVEMLKKGGNAVDAACATALALGVCEPQASGIGGQSYAILNFKGKVFCVDGSSRAPSKANSNTMRKKHNRVLGYRASTVPSTLALIGFLNKRYGRLDWSTVVKPSIRIAKRGYKITKLQHDSQVNKLKDFLSIKSRSGAKYFLKDGEVPYNIGDRFIQDDLAHTLSHISKNGWNSFYRGIIANQIDKDMINNNGLLRAEDLSLIPEPIVRKPLHRNYRGVGVYVPPPPTAGATLLLVLMMMSHFPSKFLTGTNLESFHFMSEIYRKAFLHRTQRPFDPDTYHQTTDENHLSRKFAYSLAKSIRNTVDPTLPLKNPEQIEDTTHLSVMDDEGNAVGITQSIELVYGSKVAADGLGFLYNNYMAAYEYENVNHPYFIRPNTVPWTSVSPAILFNNNKLWMVVGSPGSERIFSTVGGFLSAVIDNDMDIRKAMLKPRFHCSIGGTISFEAERFDPKIINYLDSLTYKVQQKEPFAFYHGAIHAVMKCQSMGGFQGVAEARRDGTAEGVN